MRTLGDVELYETVEILQLKSDIQMQRRLMDLGFIENGEVTPILNSPKKGMRAYLIKGCKIALRDQESRSIFIKKKGEESVV